MKSIRIFVIGFFFSFGLYFSQNCLAKEWYFQPSAHFETFYDDNIRLFPDTFKTLNKDAFGFISSANANIGVRSDKFDIGINASGVINRYISDFDLDSDNVFLNAKSIFNVTERNLFGLKGRYIRDTTLTSIIDSRGVVQQNTPRTTLSINPEWTYALSKLTSIRADYKHDDVSYEQSALIPLFNPFFDYTTDSASIELSHQWNASLKYYVTFDVLIFDVPDLNETTKNYSPNVGMDYNFSETWTGSFEVGVYKGNSEFNLEEVTVKKSFVGPLFSFKTKKTFETAKLEAGYSRETTSSGRSGFSLLDTSFLQYSQKLSDRYQLAFYAYYNKIQGIANINSNINDRNSFTSYSAAPSISWLISPQLDLTARYQFRFSGSGNSDNSANSNTVSLFLNYKWDMFSTSKF